MKKYNSYFISAVAMIMFWTGCMYESIGKVCERHIFKWDLPIAGFLLLSIMFLCGYLAGRDDYKK